MDPIYESYRRVIKPKFKDNAKGAVAALKDMMAQRHYNEEFKGGKVTQDPKIRGVWMIQNTRFPKRVAIVYLGGYKDAFGEVRDHDDFEEAEKR